MESSALLEVTMQNNGCDISPELYKMRLDFCRDVMRGKCSDNDCPIYRKYYDTELSCNGALRKYPDECKVLMAVNTA